MKRIFTILLAFTMVLCLFACDNGGNGGGAAYTGDLDGAKTKLVINGNKATFSAEVENDLGEAKVKITNKVTQTGIIESNEDGVITVVFNKTGATASMSMKITGSGAAEYIKNAKAQFESMEAGAYKDAMLKLVNGKTLNMKYGDDYWETVGPTSDNVIVVKIDTAKMTFTQMDSGIG
jgi:hypothetical protein